ncbi:MAG TPA: VOC family protein [Candidatus Ruania gallistercoris]|uniref:VOC family protein n=1 Tax=Candidatus Ruania gallistercoris TaxID=2838746 RepID=A0A9D2J456_9MICO|nr:VOC family protein [Candidatus Ruania gallistercoris]
MDQRLSLVTLVVENLDRARSFYSTGLGWSAEVDVPGEVLMVQVGEHLLLSLWQREHAEAEIGPVTRGGTPPVTLAHNLATAEEVDAVLAQARAAGAVAEPATWRSWGGYSGYFTDPDGFRWEIAVNPTPLGESLLP